MEKEIAAWYVAEADYMEVMFEKRLVSLRRL